MIRTQQRFLQVIVNLPRLVRIIIVAFFALMAVATVFPLVDYLYLRYFFTADSVIIPSLISVAIGGIVYGWGWIVYVGTVGTKPSAEKAILWYFGVGGVLTIVALGLLIYGIYDLNVPLETA